MSRSCREVNPSDKICQSVKRTEGDGWSSVEIKIPGKIEALNTLPKCASSRY
jgi:hypothetical protein